LALESENGFLFERGSLVGAFFGVYGMAAAILFSFIHHTLMNGVIMSAVFLVTQGVSFVTAEFLDAAGIPIFGPHKYAEIIPTLPNGVPIGVSVGLYSLLYCIMAMGNIILHGTPKSRSDPKMGIPQIVIISFCQSLLLIAVDIILEPICVAAGLVSWNTTGDCSLFFGVPIRNFVGWFLVSFPSYFLHNFLVAKIGMDLPPHPEILNNLPIVILCCFYVWLQCVVSKVGLGAEMHLISSFTVGLPVSLAIYRACYGDKQCNLKLDY